jgi:hypothetical protein
MMTIPLQEYWELNKYYSKTILLVGHEKIFLETNPNEVNWS